MVKGAFSPVGRNPLGNAEVHLNFTDELTGWFSTQVKVKITTGRNRSNRLSGRRFSEEFERSGLGRSEGQFSEDQFSEEFEHLGFGRRHRRSARRGRHRSRFDRFEMFGRRRFGPFLDGFGRRRRTRPETSPDSPSTPLDSPSTPLDSPSMPPDSPSMPPDSPSMPLDSPSVPPDSPSTPLEPVTNGYDIELIFTGDGWANNTYLQAAFQSAVDRLETVIVGDLADVQINGQLIDDLRITAELVDIDGSGGILGQAGPTQLRADSYLPADGIMRFDSADAVNLYNQGEWDDVILHEMLHVVGFGTIWEPLGLVEGSGTDSPQYVGASGLAAYNDLLGLSSTYIPLEASGGPGTTDSHWDETIFDTELMTGFLDSGSGSPLSGITVQSLADLGYQLAPADVLTAATDAYAVPTTVV